MEFHFTHPRLCFLSNNLCERLREVVILFHTWLNAARKITCELLSVPIKMLILKLNSCCATWNLPHLTHNVKSESNLSSAIEWKGLKIIKWQYKNALWINIWNEKCVGRIYWCEAGVKWKIIAKPKAKNINNFNQVF